MRQLVAGFVALGLLAGTAVPAAADPRWHRDDHVEALIERRADHRDDWVDRRHHLIERRVDHRDDRRDNRRDVVERRVDRRDDIRDHRPVGPGYWVDR